jgi:hypothetical protein
LFDVDVLLGADDEAVGVEDLSLVDLQVVKGGVEVD